MTARALLLVLVCATAFVAANAFSQEIPLVYDVEHTGASFARPVLPAFEKLQFVRPLPDPFQWSDGSGRSTRFTDWSRRRAEIKAEIEHYGIGQKPPRPKDITASYADETLTVKVTENGETLTLTARIQLPSGNGPFPAVIGIGRGSGSLPGEIFASRNIARVSFNFGQVMSHTQKRGKEPINRLYPDLTYMGAYSAWSWGVSRLIDGLQLAKDDLPIDLEHLAVTGCSFAGKMALFAGAFDERIALTIAQESGGGGAAAWRVSETLGNVETLGNTSSAWFIEDMFRFANRVPTLPYDHHELMAMVAPRALLVLGNPDYEWLADESGYVSCRAAHEVWKTFGIADRFGFSIVAGHRHCQLPESQSPEVEAFVDKFLLGKANANTSVTKHPFAETNHRQWYDGWLTGTSTFPEPDATNVESIFYEAELAKHGSDWNQVDDPNASNGMYLTIKPGLNSPSAVPTDSEGIVQIPFIVSGNSKYFVFARVNCPTADDDSFWVKIDDGKFAAANGLRTTGWDWVQLTNAKLTAGEHTLTLTYREDGALIDKIGITTYVYGPDELGDDAANAQAPASAAAVLQPFVDRHELAGAVALVADRDNIVSVDTVGFSDVEAETAIKPDAMFWIASQSKGMTATAVMMLVDEGKISLDDPVEKYLPEFRGQMVVAERDEEHKLLRKPRHPITIREVLSHVSGLPYRSAIEEPTLDGLPLAAAVRSYAMTPLETEPGTHYQYSNAGINTAARIIEVVTGTKYEEFMQQRLFDPLGMKDTTFWPNDEQVARMAKSYRPDETKAKLVEFPFSQLKYPLTDRARRFPMPAGGLFSTASDTATFCRMLLRGGELDGRRYLSEAAFHELTKRQTPDSVPNSYGLGLAVGKDWFGHGGARATNMEIYPQRGLVLIWMVQHGGFPGDGAKARDAFKNWALSKK
jgi:CubicO group peptidase (beta-lactamase class C family)